MKTQRPSIFRILFTDSATYFALVVPFAVWAIYLYLAFTHPTANTSLLYIGIGTALAAIPIILIRILYFYKMFRIGSETSGVVQRVFFYRSRGRVTYDYTFQGTDYHSGSAIMKTARSGRLRPDQEVTLLVDPNQPKRAVVKELYQ